MTKDTSPLETDETNFAHFYEARVLLEDLSP